MIDFEIIRELREQRQWTQEQMAEKLGLTRNGYAKIERGESTPTLTRLEDIAQVLGIRLSDLLQLEHKNVVYQIGENYHGNNNTYHNTAKLEHEIETLKLIITHKDELLAQKDSTITALKQLIQTTTPTLEEL